MKLTRAIRTNAIVAALWLAWAIITPIDWLLARALLTAWRLSLLLGWDWDDRIRNPQQSIPQRPSKGSGVVGRGGGRVHLGRSK